MYTCIWCIQYFTCIPSWSQTRVRPGMSYHAISIVAMVVVLAVLFYVLIYFYSTLSLITHSRGQAHAKERIESSKDKLLGVSSVLPHHVGARDQSQAVCLIAPLLSLLHYFSRVGLGLLCFSFWVSSNQLQLQYVTKAGLELLIFLSLLPKFFNDRRRYFVIILTDIS